MNESISSNNSDEQSAIQNQIDSSLKEAKEVVQQLELERGELDQLFDNKIASIKSEITEVAIDKTLSLLSNIRNWILIFGLFITFASFLLGFIGLKDIKGTATSYFEGEVERWLRFEKRDGPVKKSLNEIRTRALLDAYSIKLSRSVANPFGVRSVELNSLEQERILSILLDPETSFGDFIDALRLITSSRGVIRFWNPVDKIGKQIADLLVDDDISPEKRWQIISYMRMEQVLLPYTKKIIEHEANEDSIKAIAFENIALFDIEYAKEYAIRELYKDHKDVLKQELAVFLAKNESDFTYIKKYLTKMHDLKPDGWSAKTFDVIYALLTRTERDKKADDIIIKELASLVDKGGVIKLSEKGFGPQYLLFSVVDHNAIHYSHIEDARLLLSNSDLFHSIFNSRHATSEWIIKFVKAFEIKDFNNYVSTVAIDLGSQTIIHLKNKEKVMRNDIVGSGWLKIEKIANKTFPVFIWRDQVGIINKVEIDSIEGFDDSELFLSYDEETIGNLSSRHLNNTYLGW